MTCCFTLNLSSPVILLFSILLFRNIKKNKRCTKISDKLRPNKYYSKKI